FEDQLELACDLDPWRLQALEDSRAGGTPVFWVQIWPVLFMSGRKMHTKVGPFRVEVPRDRWLAFLEGAEYGSFEVLEVRIPRDRQIVFQRAVEHLREARRKLSGGQFDDAVGYCRKAIEALAIDLGVAPDVKGFTSAFSVHLPEKRA